MKKVLLWLFCGVLIFGVTGCGVNKPQNNNVSGDNQSSTSEGSIDNDSITNINVIYNNIEYNLEDMAKVLFDDGWVITSAISQTYDLSNDKYDYEIEIRFPEGSVEEAKELEATTGNINSTGAIEKLSNTKIMGLKVIKNNRSEGSDNFSVFGINLKTNVSEVPSLLPTITTNFDSNSEDEFQRMNDYYSINIKCIGSTVYSIDLKLYYLD